MKTIQVILYLLFATTVAHAEISADGKKFAGEIVGAGWSGRAQAGPIRIECRNVALFSTAGLDAMAHVDELSAAEGDALRDFARVTITQPVYGWGRRLEAGEYRVGFDRDTHGALGLDVRRKNDSALIAQDGLWVYGSFDDLPATSASQSGGRVTAVLSFGSLALEFCFVEERAHRELTSGLDPYRSRDGHMVLFSDLPWKQGLQSLVEEASAALPEYSRRLGASASPPYEVHVIGDREKYVAACDLIASGEFKHHDGFSSHNTGQAYIHFPGTAEELLIGGRVPFWLRVFVLHELHHLVTRDTHPRTFSFWPTWFSEGLCEIATEQALARTAKEDGELFRELRMGILRGALLRNALPAGEDILAWQHGGDLATIYSTAYQLVFTAVARKERFRSTMSLLKRGGGPEAMDLRLREDLASGHGSIDDFFDKAFSSGVRRADGPAWRQGYYDRVGENWHRLYCGRDRTAQVLFPEQHGHGDFRLDGEFSFLPDDKCQADVFFGFRGGASSQSYLKLAIMPKAVVLFRYTTAHGWTRIGTVNFDEELEVGSAEKPVWHRWTIIADARAEKIRLEHANGRSAEFTSRPMSLVGTRHGIGVYGGMVYFRNIKAK